MEVVLHVVTDVSPQGWLGPSPEANLIARFEGFARGDWTQLVAASEVCDDSVASARRRSGRRQLRNDIALRATRAEFLVQLGEL